MSVSVCFVNGRMIVCDLFVLVDGSLIVRECPPLVPAAPPPELRRAPGCLWAGYARSRRVLAFLQEPCYLSCWSHDTH